MKSYSDDTVTKADVANVTGDLQHQLNGIDYKQTEQIKKLRMWLAASFFTNLVFTIGFCVYHCARM